MGAIGELLVEGRDASGFVCSSTPRLSWKVVSDSDGWRQGGAEVELTRGGQVATAPVDGDRSFLVDWPFEALAPRERVSLRVRAADEGGVWTNWCEPIRIRSGALGPEGWVGEAIGVSSDDARRVGQPILLRREFVTDGSLLSATLYASAYGVYQVEVNGTQVDDQVLKPGWTPYDKRTVFEVTDITDLVRAGANCVGAQVAGGWFTESYGFSGRARPVYGEQPRFMAQVVLEYPERTEVVATDGDWRATTQGPIVSSGIYDGEHYDARRRCAGFSAPGFDDSDWLAVEASALERPPTPRTSPAVRVTEVVDPVEILTTPSGRTVVDFGQNLVGRVRLTLRAPRDTVVTLRHAEVLEDGELGTRPLRLAAATDSWTSAGDGPESWAPQFTFHGFRYAEVAGWPEREPMLGAITAEVVHSDMRRTGWFECSDPLLDKFHENVVWGMRGNFLSLPTDCPQRDERLGWTGDIEVFAPTAAFLYDVDAFLSSWLTDLALEQTSAGCVPFVVPNVLSDSATPAAAWGDAATVVPSVLFERYGDVEVLRRQFTSMRSWVEHLRRLAGDRCLWEGGFQFGDWLDPDAPPDRPGDAKVDNDIVASAYLYHSARLAQRAARLLGDDEAAEDYEAYAERVRRAWLAEYCTPAGRIMSDAPTAYALAIAFGIAQGDAVSKLGDRLAELCEKNDYRIGTGFVGTPIIADALTRTGHLDIAGRMLLCSQCPSWLYPVTMGATTVWERWDSMLPDGSINPGEMTSFNHYALGAVADWMHRTVAGLAPLAPGYQVIDAAPHPVEGLEFARAAHETPLGRAEVGWRRDGAAIVVDVVVPANARARVTLPNGEVLMVGSGAREWRVPEET